MERQWCLEILSFTPKKVLELDAKENESMAATRLLSSADWLQLPHQISPGNSFQTVSDNVVGNLLPTAFFSRLNAL